MAIPSCPKCNATKFQSTTTDVQDAKFKIQIIHCASCGCAIGTQDYYNAGELILILAKKLGQPLN